MQPWKKHGKYITRAYGARGGIQKRTNYGESTRSQPSEMLVARLVFGHRLPSPLQDPVLDPA